MKRKIKVGEGTGLVIKVDLGKPKQVRKGPKADVQSIDSQDNKDPVGKELISFMAKKTRERRQPESQARQVDFEPISGEPLKSDFISGPPASRQDLPDEDKENVKERLRRLREERSYYKNNVFPLPR